MKTYQTDFFVANAEKYGISLSEKQITQFMKYYELLVEWNSFMNLTAITEFDEVIVKHFLDSITLEYAFAKCDRQFEYRDKCMIDIGTGAGFPGVPLKIIYPDMQVTLLDSLNKRINFLNTVIGDLGLTGIETIHGRAEDYSKPGKRREQYDLCVSRAVANLSTLSEYCLPYVKTGGYFVPYKSEKTKDEIQAAGHALQLLGGETEGQAEFYLADTDIYRNLILIHKCRKTPDKYPRKSGLPAKEPL